MNAHTERQRAMYGSADPPRPDPEQLRRQLADCRLSLSSMIAEAANRPTPERLERLSIQLQGVARLAGSLRTELLAEARDGAAA